MNPDQGYDIKWCSASFYVVSLIRVHFAITYVNVLNKKRSWHQGYFRCHGYDFIHIFCCNLQIRNESLFLNKEFVSWFNLYVMPNFASIPSLPGDPGLPGYPVCPGMPLLPSYPGPPAAPGSPFSPFMPGAPEIKSLTKAMPKFVPVLGIRILNSHETTSFMT